MIKNLLWHGLPALTLAALPQLTTAPASHAAVLWPAAVATFAAAPAVPGAPGGVGAVVVNGCVGGIG
ncbi:hypothetical protein [Streptomyces sp. NPDC002209]|uniref:hypothetical protein n=1 Tax=Streptomyces sp. NPDC002209 TaxID=3364638 RepID=UPI0036B89EF9